MTEMDYACSYFDVAANFMCNAQPGQLCSWLDEKGQRCVSHNFHPERVEAARSMDDGPGDVPSVDAFEHALELDGRI